MTDPAREAIHTLADVALDMRERHGVDLSVRPYGGDDDPRCIAIDLPGVGGVTGTRMLGYLEVGTAVFAVTDAEAMERCPELTDLLAMYGISTVREPCLTSQ